MFEVFAGLHDGRDARGVRYALTTILVFVVLAKFAGIDSLRAVAQWIKQHRNELSGWLGLAEVRIPNTTLCRFLSKTMDVPGFERIENGLHYRRDDTLCEDRCTVRFGHAAHMMAALNNLVLGLLRRTGWTNIRDARRHYQKHPHTGTALIFNRL